MEDTALMLKASTKTLGSVASSGAPGGETPAFEMTMSM